MRGRKNFALLMSMRTGKSKVVVDDWGEMVAEGQCDDLIVVAPAGAYLPWGQALDDDLPDWLREQVVVHTWTSSTARTRRERDALSRFLEEDRPRVLLINSEALSAVREARDLCLKLTRQRRTEVVVDESVIIKNTDSTLGKFCVDALAPLASHRRILTGLVSPRSPLDVYNQFRFLDPKIFPEPWEKFRDRYAEIHRICQLPRAVVQSKMVRSLRLDRLTSGLAVRQAAQFLWPEDDFSAVPAPMLQSMVAQAPETMKTADMVAAIFRAGHYIRSIPVIRGYRNVEEIQQRIAPHSFRVRLEDCYDMPESDYSFRDVAMTAEQERAYTEMREFATTELEGEQHVTASSVVTRMLRLHQILCGHSVTEEGLPVEIPENRTRALVQLLSDYDGKAIVWCSYDADVRKVSVKLTEAFGDGSVARFWGGNRDTREAEEKFFKTTDECRFMVATQAAGGRGRTWDAADLVCYYSSTDNLDHRAQSEDRPKNVGKTRPVAYVDLRCPGTVEDKIIGCLRKKIDLASVVSGDDFRRWLV